MPLSGLSRKGSRFLAGAGLLLCSTLSQLGCEKVDLATSEPCRMEAAAGPCRAMLPRYFYDRKKGACSEFAWGGCQGSVPFETLEACKNTCHCEN